MNQGAGDPIVSVIIVVLNGEPYIGQQLLALSRQEVDFPWEVVVADNGSTDGTVSLVSSWADRLPVPLRLVDASAARGIPYARNVGAKASRGEFLAYCDCDDLVGPGWLAAAELALRTSDVVSGRNRLMTDPLDPDGPLLNPSGLWGQGIQTGNFGVRRAVLFAVGGFDESLPPYGCEDAEFSIRLLKGGHAISPAPGMEIYFRPTTELRRLAKKVYSSGKAEAVVWARHPDRFPGRLAPTRLVADLITWPIEAARAAGGPGGMTAKQFARGAITRVGHLTGYLTWVRNGRASQPRLIREAP